MIDAMIITHNEALNLPYCLDALQGWTRKIFVIDSGSTDQTPQIAESFDAQFIHHDWEGYAQQKNWALRNLPFESDWILIVDADEIITPPLREMLIDITKRPPDQVPENGFFINRLTYFMGRPIRHCGFYPSWNLRFFKRGHGYYEDREVHEHIIVDDPVGYVREPMIHQDRRGMENYVAKHNRYSTLEARELFWQIQKKLPDAKPANIPKETRRRRWLKRHISPYIPMPGLWRFLYMFVFRMGVLDGAAGYQFCKFISWYDSLVSLKLRELRRQLRHGEVTMTDTLPAPTSGLAQAEGAEAVLPLRTRPAAEPTSYVQMQPEPSPWHFREKVIRAIWMVFARPVFRLSFHNWYRFRAAILRLFGAKIGRGVAIRPTVNVEVPWMLEIEDDATVGDHAILYSLGTIHIGKRAIVSQYAHLCAGTHDYTDHRFRLVRAPITVGDDVWIGADAFIGPNVKIGRLTVVGARSSVYGNLPEAKVCVGNPAKPIKDRQLR